jgi:hypothetical protein
MVLCTLQTIQLHSKGLVYPLKRIEICLRIGNFVCPISMAINRPSFEVLMN